MRLLDRILDAAIDGRLCLEVEEQPGSARVAVARLPDRARVEGQRWEARSTCDPSSPRASVRLLGAEAEGDVAVPDEHERLLGRLERKNATSGARTYSQTGSRGLAWKSSARSSAAQAARATRGSGAARPRGPRPSSAHSRRHPARSPRGRCDRARRGRGFLSGRRRPARRRARSSGSAVARNRRRSPRHQTSSGASASTERSTDSSAWRFP